MTSEEVADMQLTRVIEMRLERDAETDQAFQSKVDRLPSDQSEALKEERFDKVAKIRDNDERMDVMLRHALIREVESQCTARGINRDDIPAEKANEIGKAAFENCLEYRQEMALRDSYTNEVDRDVGRSVQSAVIEEQNLGQREKLTANDVLSGAQTQGLEQDRHSTSARIVPSLGEVQGPPRALSKTELLYETATPDTKARVDDIRQQAADMRQAESAAYTDPKVREERVNAAMKEIVSKPANTYDLEGGPSQKFRGAQEVRERAEKKVAGDHLTTLANIDREARDGIDNALNNDPNNLARFRSMEQPLDPRTNSKEAREIAVARVEERRERQRELTREFNQKTDPFER